MVFQMQEGRDFYFSLLGCKRTKADCTKEQRKIIRSQEKLALNHLVKKAVCLFLTTFWNCKIRLAYCYGR